MRQRTKVRDRKITRTEYCNMTDVNHAPDVNVLDELKAIVASLYYLESEARKIGLNDVSLIFRKAIADIDVWLKKGHIEQTFYYENIIDSDLYRILRLLDYFSQSNRFDLQSIIKVIESYESLEKNKSKLAA